MRLEAIAVRGLLKQFNYTIPLHTSERVTIIHGPNGYGKTTLLKLIEAFYRGDYDELRVIPFDLVELFFSYGIRLAISKELRDEAEEPDGASPELQLVCTLYTDTELVHRDVIKRGRAWMGSFRSREIIHRYLPFLTQVGPEVWQDSRTGELLTSEALIPRYADAVPSRHRVFRKPKDPDWLKEHKEQFRVRFIQSQRLLTEARERRAPSETHTSTYEYTVNAYARELSETISYKIAEYGALTASYERSFPTRFVAQDDSLGGPTKADVLRGKIKARLEAIERKREDLQSSGLLDKQVDDRLALTPSFSDAKLVFLDLYTQDVETKLKIFDDLAARIRLFTAILNKKFSYKTVSISREKGFVIAVDGLGELAPQGLSSGEQHELVLCFELLFKTGPDFFVMIDEPEISLHVEWQEAFLADLQKMADLARFDSLIATHSPIIVGDRWDVAVSLSQQIDTVAV